MKKEVEIRFPLPVDDAGIEPVTSATFRLLCDEFDDYYEMQRPVHSMSKILVASCTGLNGNSKRPDAQILRQVFGKMKIPVRVYVFDSLLKASDPNGAVTVNVQCARDMHRYDAPLIGDLPLPPSDSASPDELQNSKWLIESQLELKLEEPIEVLRSGQVVVVDKLVITHGNGFDQEAVAEDLMKYGIAHARRTMRVRRIKEACGINPINHDFVKKIGRGDRKRWEQWDRDNSIIDEVATISHCPECGAENRSLKDYSLFF